MTLCTLEDGDSEEAGWTKAKTRGKVKTMVKRIDKEGYESMNSFEELRTEGNQEVQHVSNHATPDRGRGSASRLTMAARPKSGKISDCCRKKGGEVMKRRWGEGVTYAPPGLEVEDLTLCDFTEAQDEWSEPTLNEMTEKRENRKGWEKVAAVVDTGAEEHALPEDIGEWLEITPSAASKAGRGFRGAGGDRIAAKGKRTMVGKTAEGHVRKIAWEVCPVKRPLLSVGKMTRTGNVAWFGEDKAFIKNLESGETTWLRKQRNAWMLDIWIKKPEENQSGFPRQEGQ